MVDSVSGVCDNMSHEILIKRTIYVSVCPGCGDRKEVTENPPKSRFCGPCGIWVSFEEVSYIGPEIKPGG
jgi:hypothetical protein